MIYDKDERKEYVMREADTAQTVFESYLDTLPKNTIELNIPESLNGTVDLGVFPSKGLTKIKHVFFFSPGQITSIVNIPKNLQSLHCNDNLLSELPDLPETLQILQVSNNMLTSINVYPCVQLKKLHISENRITSISGLPPSLIRLYCDHNQLTSLNLASTTLLTTLICNDNPQLVLENLPKTLLHVEYPTTIRQQHYVSTEIPSVEYIEQFKRYLTLKGTYMMKQKELQEKKSNELFFCYGCSKRVGMIFSNKNGQYTAQCGGTPPCGWNIVLHRGFYNSIDEVIDTYSSIVDELKQSIIQRKMDILFHFMNEKEAMKLYEEEKDAYETATKYLDKIKNEYDTFYHSTEKKKEVEKLQYEINQELEYVKEALAEKRYKDAAEIQSQKIFPLSQSLQKLQYEIMDVDYYYDRIHIIQEPVHFTKLEVNLKEAPAVGK
jgi:hypothetical protein